jgi:hypothetical protein
MFWEGKFYSVGLIYARNGNKFKVGVINFPSGFGFS